MYYFPAHRLGFFHIPKTGGTAFSRFLIDAMSARNDAPREIAHIRWHEDLAAKAQVLGEDVFPQSIILTTIRNPYAVVVSLYFWCRKKVELKHQDLRDYPEMAVIAAMGFSDYMDWYMENERPFEHYFLVDGRVPDNLRILRLENIEAEASAILNGELKLGIDVAVPVFNASTHGPVMSYLDDNAIRRINEKYAWAFANFYGHEKVVPV